MNIRMLLLITVSTYMHFDTFSRARIMKYLPPLSQKLASELTAGKPLLSTLGLSAQRDLDKPLTKMLADTLYKKRAELKKNVTLKKQAEHTAFLLKDTLEEMYKNPALNKKTWDTLLPNDKQTSFFAPAFQAVLKTRPEAVKNALSIIFSTDAKIRDFVRSIPTFVDQTMLRSWWENPAKRTSMNFLFEERNGKLTLKQSLVDQLNRMNLGLPTLELLGDIGQNFYVLGSYVIYDQKTPWENRELWFPLSKESDKALVKHTLLNEMALEMYTIYSLRDWFKSPGIAQQRFSPWYFVPSGKQKFFPQEGEVFATANLNSAEVLPTGTAYFRNEELLKSVTHEMIHGIMLESNINVEKTSAFLLEHCAIDRVDKAPIALTEALVESLASFVHTVFMASRMAPSPVSFKKRMKELWALQKSFIFYQAAKLLYTYGFSSMNEFVNPKTTTKRVRQTTAAAEYYIMRAAVLFEPETFLALLKDRPANLGEQLAKLIVANLENKKFQKRSRGTLIALKKIMNQRNCLEQHDL